LAVGQSVTLAAVTAGIASALYGWRSCCIERQPAYRLGTGSVSVQLINLGHYGNPLMSPCNISTRSAAVTTLPASQITTTSAVIPEASTQRRKCLRTASKRINRNYGMDAPHFWILTMARPPNGDTSLTGLAPGTTYHFRASAAVPPDYKRSDLTFTTLNANLASMTLSAGTLTPAFNAAHDLLCKRDQRRHSITVTPVAFDDQATITVNGVPVVTGEPAIHRLGYGYASIT